MDMKFYPQHHKTRQNIYVVWGLRLTGREQVNFELLSRSKKFLHVSFIYCVSIPHTGGLGNSGLVHGMREWEYETYVSKIYYIISSPRCYVKIQRGISKYSLILCDHTSDCSP